ncbi:unnamed protein product [Mytilus edulis]|uniref:B box-type domain-containing protein n=1 Tax=Mytilus edulis TaxID=6550 RepID=A0A8S3ULQ3_MYTED|nr:unnamed protein product [Mytilus edulis]
MANHTFQRDENQEKLKSPKPLQCRFHDTEEYTIYCKDCKDFMCFKCLGQLHQKHDLSPLQDADEDIRKEMEDLLFGNKYAEQLNSLSDNVSDKEKELVQDEETITREIRTSVDKMKQNINLTEKRLLSELRHTFESNLISLQEQKTIINNLQTEIAILEVDKLPRYNLNNIINIISEMKVCSATCDKIIKHPKPGFKPTMEFLVGNLILSDENLEDDVSALPSCSDVSIQTDFQEDSDTEWFDAEDMVEEGLIETSSDEIADEYPIKFQLKQNTTLVGKIVHFSEKDAWIIANRKLLKIVDHSLQDDVYADKVDDFVILKDGCVLVLSSAESFVMKLLPNRRLVRFADVGIMCTYLGCNPYCISIKMTY